MHNPHANSHRTCHHLLEAYHLCTLRAATLGRAGTADESRGSAAMRLSLILCLFLANYVTVGVVGWGTRSRSLAAGPAASPESHEDYSLADNGISYEDTLKDGGNMHPLSYSFLSQKYLSQLF